ncbi:MAG: flavin reductase family protein [Prevotella sp.]|nr:flavin reductase family protein [Prevotella sp.]
MKKSLGVKPYIFPQPVLIIATYDENGHPNAMNAAWGGMADDNEIMICLSQHKTTANLAINHACTIAMGDVAQVTACDYVGIASGNKVPDKIAKVGWTVTKSTTVNAPIINELPLTLECTLVKVIDDVKYIFRIENVLADEKILTDGQVDLKKFHPITYDPAQHGYYALGAKIGQAFADGRKI